MKISAKTLLFLILLTSMTGCSRSNDSKFMDMLRNVPVGGAVVYVQGQANVSYFKLTRISREEYEAIPSR